LSGIRAIRDATRERPDRRPLRRLSFCASLSTTMKQAVADERARLRTRAY
jgi:hypothetical protein